MKTILTVDDSASVRQVVKIALGGAGYSVIEAATAGEAISALGSGTRVDLVFSDVYMPGSLDGHGLARWVGSTSRRFRCCRRPRLRRTRHSSPRAARAFSPSPTC